MAMLQAGGEHAVDTFTSSFFKFPIEVRSRIYDMVFEKEVLDSTNMFEDEKRNSLYLTLGDQNRPKQFFHYLHVNRAFRADVIELFLSQITFTIDLEALVCVLQLLTPAMRLAIHQLCLVGNFGHTFRCDNIENVRQLSEERGQHLELGHHRSSEKDARYMGLKDMLHISLADSRI